MKKSEQNNTRTVFLRGKKIILRPYDKVRDLSLFTRWINDPYIRQFITINMPITIQEEERAMEKKEGDVNDVFLVIETLKGKTIGTMGLHKIHWVDRTATTGAIIGEKAYLGRGYGTDAKITLLDYAFNTLNLRKVCSAVIAFNKRSYAYLLKTGYTVEGVRKKQHYRHGRYHDEILLAITKTAFNRMMKEKG